MGRLTCPTALPSPFLLIIIFHCLSADHSTWNRATNVLLGLPPCQGDPTDPSGGGCDQCWDFFYVQFQIDGNTVNTKLVGVPGNTNQSGTLTFGPICTNGAANAGFVVQTQTWAADETITFSNLKITCWDASTTSLAVSPDPACEGQAFILTATLTDPPAVASTLWTGPGTISAPSSLNTAVNNAPVGTNTYTFTATDDNACTSSNTLEVTVTQMPTMDNLPNITVCAEDLVDITFTGNGNPDYNWSNSNTAIGLDATGTGNISFTALSDPVPWVIGTITVVPSENGCLGQSHSFTISTRPLPILDPHPDSTYCEGEWIWIWPHGIPNHQNNSYWAGVAIHSDNQIVWPDGGWLALGVGLGIPGPNIGQQEIANITFVPQYSDGGCPMDPIMFTITVNPEIELPDYPALDVCAGNTVQVGLATPDFTWTNSNPAIGLAANGTGDISFVAANVSSITTGQITVTPVGGCYGPPKTFAITVHPIPIANPVADVEVCEGASISKLFTGTTGTTFNWTNNNTAIGLPGFGTGNINFTTGNVSQQEVATITVTPENSFCVGNPISFTITVNPAPTVDDPLDKIVCINDFVELQFSGMGNSSYIWTNSNTDIGLEASGTDNITFIAAPVVSPTTGIVTVTPTDNGCPGLPQTVLITVVPPPTMNPPGNVLACGGTSVTVPFLGAPGMSYSWTNSDTIIGLGLSGNDTIHFTAALLPMRDTAKITVTPSLGTCAGPPVSFLIIIEPAPTVADPPDQTVCSGTLVNVAFSGSANPSFSWLNSNTGIGLDSSGTGNLSFSADSIGLGVITVTPSENGCLGPSQSFDISVVGLPVVQPPMDLNACTGDSVVLSFTGTPGASFSWTNTNAAIGLGLSGMGDISFKASNVASPTTGSISITPTLGVCIGAAQHFDITIHPLPGLSIGAVTCTPDLLSYQIDFNSNGTIVTTSAGSLSGSGGNFTLSSIPVGTNVTIFISDTLTGCQTQQSVNAPNCNCSPVSSPTTPNNSTICEGAPNPPLTVSTVPGNTVDWYSAPIGGVLLLAGSASYTPPGPFAPGSYSFYAEARETSTNCTSPTRLEVILTVNAVPTVTQPADQTVCDGVPVAINFAGTASATMNWTNSEPNIGLAANGVGDVSFSALNTGNGPLTANLWVTPSLNGCTGTAQNFVITVNPLPNVALPGNQTICAGMPVLVNFAGTNGANLDWTNSNTAIGLGANGSGDISFTAANVAAPTLANLTVTPSLNSCTGPAQNFNIIINPTPVVTAPADQIVCVGTAISVNFTGSSGAVFGWTNSNPSIGLAANGMDNINFLSTNAGNTPLTGNLIITPTLSGCLGTPQNFSITINPIPSIAVDSTVCSGDLMSYSIYANSSASILSSSAGTVSGNGPNFDIIGIPSDTDVVLTVLNPTTGCSQQLPVAGPNCLCPPIMPPSGPNAPEICEGDPTPALTISVGPGLTTDWYSTPSGGVALLIGSTSFTPPGLLGPGVYTYYVESRESGSGCTSGDRTPVLLTVQESPSMVQPVDQTVCSGAVVSAAFTGTAGSGFGWTNSNPDIGLPSSGSGDISFISTTAAITQTAQIAVTPQLGMCTGPTQSFFVTINPLPVVDISGNTSICNGDGTMLNVTGGTNLVWSTGETTASININPGGNSTYTATVTENGCTASSSVTVIVNQPTTATVQVLTCDPAEVGTTLSHIPNVAGCDSAITTVTTLDIPGCSFTPILSNAAVSCFGAMDGVLILGATGGIPPYQYTWSNGTQSGTGQISNVGNPVQIQNLIAGNYTVTITAANGITSTVSAQIASPGLLTAQASAQIIFGQNALSCNGATDGVIQGSANGGTVQYQYVWSVAGQNSAILSGIGAGTYTLTVIDAHQCSATSSVTIPDPAPLAFELAVETLTCGDSSAVALITPLNGTQPFSLNIDGVQSPGGLMPSLAPGNHAIEIMDANGCKADTTVHVIMPAGPSISLPAEARVLLGETLVLVAQTNLTSWQNLSWTPTPDSSCANCLRQEWMPDVSQVYQVVISDDGGCTASALVRVIVDKAGDLYVPNVFSPNGDGLNDFWTLYAGVSVKTLNSLQIFDRWGELLYFLEAPVAVNEWPGWDGNARGEPMNPGVFVYYLEVELVNGEKVVRKGDVTVVR